MEPTIVNGVNKNAVLGAQKKMNADSNFGAKAPVTVTAVWNKGVVRNADLNLVCHAPPAIAVAENQSPTALSYCPLMASGCFSLVFMMQAATRDTQLDSYTTRAKTTMDMTSFYKLPPDDSAATSPWAKGIDVEVNVKGPQDKSEYESLVQLAHTHCPSVEMLESSFPLQIKVEGKAVETNDTNMYYNMEKYNELAKQEGPILVEQAGDLTWFCQNESKEYPDAFAESKVEGDSVGVPMSQEAPVGSGKYANPVQLCAFGGLAFHLHTLAVRLASRGHAVQSMNGTFTSTMNKRKVMGVEKDTKVFPGGATLDIQVESNAPQDVVEQVHKEALLMSPANLGWSHPTPMNISLNKVD